MRQNETLRLHALSFGFFLLVLPFSAYIAILPHIQAEWQGTNTTSGLGFSTWIIGQLFAAVFVIPLIGRIPIRTMMLLSGFTLLVLNLLYPFVVVDYFTNALMRLISGMAHLTIYVAGIQLLSNLFEYTKRGKGVGIWVAASYAGSTLGMLVVGLLLQEFQWRTASFIIAIPSIPGSILFLGFLPVQDGMDLKPEKQKGWIRLKSVTNPQIWPVYLAYGLHAFELFLLRVWISALLVYAMIGTFGGREVNYQETAAVLAGLMLATGSIGVIIGGALSDRLGRIPSAILLFTLSGFCSLLIGLFYQDYFTLLILGFLAGLATASDSSIYSTLVVEMSEREIVSSNQSVQSIFGMLMGAVAPVIGGLFLDYYGRDQLQLIFLLNALVALAGVVLLFFVSKNPKKTVKQIL